MLTSRKGRRSFWQLSRSEQEGALRLAERHRDLLWNHNIDLARALPTRRSQVTDEFCARIGVTREQLGWMQEANTRIVIGVEGRRALHRVK